MKKYAVFLLILVFALTFSAVYADDLSDVMLNGVLRMGSAPEYVPFVFYDENGNMDGIDIALVEEIGRRMGVKVQTVDVAFDGLIDSLKIGQVDIIGRGMSRTASRMEQIDFTRIYYKGAAQFISLASYMKPAAVDYDSFKNMKIGVEKGTSFEQWIRDNLVSGGYADIKNIFIYSNASDLVKALNRKDVDTVVLDQDIYEELYKPTGNYQVFYEGFLEENYAFGLRKDSTLTAVVNGHLLDMLRDGTAQQIAERYFKMDFLQADAAVARPTQAPTAAPVISPVVAPTAQPAVQSCINSMVFSADVTIPDGHQVQPGERFRKIWRVYNNGTCTWTSGYSFVYVSGDQMSGQNISVPTTVVPGQSVDLAVDLVAPSGAGTYRGNWQMRSPQGTNFGQTIWVKVRVGNVQPVYPTATPVPQDDGQHYVPISINSFYADSYSGDPGECTNVYWSTNGASIIEITVDGASMYRGNSGNGSKQICGPLTSVGSHYVQLYAFNVTTDQYASFTYNTEESGQKRIVPQINYFYADPSSGYMGDTTTVYWSVSNAASVDVFVDGHQIEANREATGSAPVQATIQSIGSHNIQLVAHSVTDDATSSAIYTTKAREEEGGGWAGMNYYDNESNFDYEEDYGGWAGSNYYDDESYDDYEDWDGEDWEGWDDEDW